MSAEYTVLQCPGKGGLSFTNSKEIYMLHLTFSNCGVESADYGSSFFSGVYFDCAKHLEISIIVVTNSTGFGLYALNVVESVHIQNSVFTYNSGNTAFWYDESKICPQVTNTLLRVENSVFAYGEIWSAELFSGGVTVVLYQFTYNVDMLVRNTTLHGNQAASAGGNMLVGLIHNSNGACNLISISIEHCSITEG